MVAGGLVIVLALALSGDPARRNHSASVEERLTVCCLLEAQEIGSPAGINTQPVVGLDV